VVRDLILLRARGWVNQPEVLAIFAVRGADDVRKPTGMGLPSLHAGRSLAMLAS
jgi:hypothetical protein